MQNADPRQASVFNLELRIPLSRSYVVVRTFSNFDYLQTKSIFGCRFQAAEASCSVQSERSGPVQAMMTG